MMQLITDLAGKFTLIYHMHLTVPPFQRKTHDKNSI